MTRARLAAIFATVAGAVVLAAGAAADPAQALHSYLAAWVFATSLSVGALFWIAIARASGATWMVVFLRRAEDITSALPALALLFVPVLARLGALYPWARPPGTWDAELRAAMAPKAGYLSASFFVGRAAFYLLAWVVIAELLRRAPAARATAIAAASLPVLAFTLTFAAFDWLMSLDPGWASNVFGVYLFGGGFGAAIGLLAFLSFGPLASRVPGSTPDHAHATGRLLLTFVIFWAYIAFCQYLLVWIADLPDEVGWVKRRTLGSWGGVALALAIGHFVLPFFALLPRGVKRRARAVAWLGAWLVAAHFLDMHWVVLPELHPAFHPHWLDAGALSFVAGAAALVALLRQRGRSATPRGDPRLAAGLRYETT